MLEIRCPRPLTHSVVSLILSSLLPATKNPCSIPNEQFQYVGRQCGEGPGHAWVAVAVLRAWEPSALPRASKHLFKTWLLLESEPWAFSLRGLRGKSTPSYCHGIVLGTRSATAIQWEALLIQYSSVAEDLVAGSLQSKTPRLLIPVNRSQPQELLGLWDRASERMWLGSSGGPHPS